MNLLCIAKVLLLLMAVMLVEQDAELSQLCQAIGQLQEEKERVSGRAEKLTEELKGEYFMVGVTAVVISLLDEPL